MHWYRVGGEVSICECRSSRARLPPSRYVSFLYISDLLLATTRNPKPLGFLVIILFVNLKCCV